MSPKILIVDDDEAVRLMIREHTRRLNLETDEATNGEGALEKVHSNSYSLIVTDMMMPKMNGFDFIVQLRESAVMTPVFLLTAYPDAVSKAVGLDKNTVVIPKPVNMSKLSDHIKSLTYEDKESYHNGIMLVEISAVQVLTVRTLLENHGHMSLFTFTDAEVAYSYYSQHRDKIDLIITSMVTNDHFEGGLDLFHRIRKDNEKVPFIMWSGDQENLKKAEDAGFDGFFSKPMNPGDMLNGIHAFLSNKHA